MFFDRTVFLGSLLATKATATLSVRDGCADVWRDIASELKQYFTDSDGLCTDEARAAIRLPYKDCFPDGGCDGSVILTDECFDRRDNVQLVTICINLAQYAKKYDVGAADLINFAAAIATKACPGGPYIPFYVGRQDLAVEAPKGQIPSPSLNSTSLTDVFAERGFSPDELVALMGAHSVGTSLNGVGFDTTPGEMDSTTYYSEAQTGFSPASLPSDRSLSMDPKTIDAWNTFAEDQDAWEAAYVPA